MAHALISTLKQYNDAFCSKGNPHALIKAVCGISSVNNLAVFLCMHTKKKGTFFTTKN
jgi:hypothetical protein